MLISDQARDRPEIDLKANLHSGSRINLLSQERLPAMIYAEKARVIERE